MLRWISRQVYFNLVGESVSLNCADMTEVVGQAEILVGTVGSTVLSVRFGARPGGATVETSTSNRLTLATSTLHTTAISCKCYTSASLNVLTASGGSNDLGILTLSAFSDHAPLDVDGRYLMLGESIGGSGDAGGGAMCCFTAETRILLADRSEENICEIRPGMRLFGGNTAEKITSTTLGNRQLLGINGSPGFVSDDHRFMSDRGWVAHDHRDRDSYDHADSLRIGTKLITSEGMIEVIELQGSHDIDPALRLYDIQTNGNHQYYANGFLVHNCVTGGGP